MSARGNDAPGNANGHSEDFRKFFDLAIDPSLAVERALVPQSGTVDMMDPTVLRM
jgi:hypothetical protein